MSRSTDALLDEDWRGRARDLVQEISRIVGEPVPESELERNVRLLRHYQSVGAVSPPERQGRDAIYSYRHVLETLVVRSLVIDGWPLRKIAEVTSRASNDELLAMLPGRHAETGTAPPPANRAQELVRRFRAQTAAAEPAAAYTPSAGSARRSPSAAAGAAPARLRVELRLPYSARLVIDPERLDHLSPQDIHHLAQALEQGLRVAQRQQRMLKKTPKR